MANPKKIILFTILLHLTITVYCEEEINNNIFTIGLTLDPVITDIDFTRGVTLTYSTLLLNNFGLGVKGTFLNRDYTQLSALIHYSFIAGRVSFPLEVGTGVRLKGFSPEELEQTNMFLEGATGLEISVDENWSYGLTGSVLYEVFNDKNLLFLINLRVKYLF